MWDLSYMQLCDNVLHIPHSTSQGGFAINKQEIRRMIGGKIRKIRTEYNFSRDEMAEILEISIGAFAQIERGERGVTIFNLLKLADLFNLSTDIFLCREKGAISSSAEEKRKRINGIIANFTEDEMNLAIHIIMGIRDHKRNAAM